jgi:hypothetical protein
MKLVGNLWQRLQCAIDERRYRVVFAPDTILVKEKQRLGRAEIRLVPAMGMVCVAWDIEEQLFGFLSNEKNADGAFFVLGQGDEVEAHILECKMTLNRGTWSKVKNQLRATLLRLRALAGVLGLTITRVVCYSAFHEEEEVSPTSFDPAILRAPIGEVAAPTAEERETLAILRQQYGWREALVELRDIEGWHPHCQMKLTRRDDGICVGVREVDSQ